MSFGLWKDYVLCIWPGHDPVRNTEIYLRDDFFKKGVAIRLRLFLLTERATICLHYWGRLAVINGFYCTLYSSLLRAGVSHYFQFQTQSHPIDQNEGPKVDWSITRLLLTTDELRLRHTCLLMILKLILQIRHGHKTTPTKLHRLTWHFRLGML